MKSLHRKSGLCLLAVCVMLISATSASAYPITLIDPTTRNGGFESNTGASYAEMDHWFNTSATAGHGGSGDQTTSIRSGAAHSGSYAGIVSLASNPSISTEHTLSAGEQFELSFWYRNSGAGSAQLFWQLYYYGDESDPGFDPLTSTDIVGLFGGDVTATGTAYQQLTVPTTSALLAGDPAIGSTLYLRLYRTGGDGQFPTVDDVTLTVIPEPASLALLGIGGLLMLRRRRA